MSVARDRSHAPYGAAAPTMQEKPQTLIHDDISVGRILASSGRVSVIDFDTVAMDDPLDGAEAQFASPN